MTELSERIARLSPEKRALLERLLKEKGVGDSRLPIIPQQKTANTLPLSFAQQRLWFLDQLEPGNHFYNVFDTLSFSGPLNVAALQQSLNEVVRRHEVLRTTFSTVEGEPVQVIAPNLSWPLPVVDLRALAETEKESEASRLATEEARQPFDLARGPLMRARLLRLSENKQILLLALHHIISDAWSLGILGQELRVLYEAFRANQPSPLTELPIQYADFAVWQRQWLQGEVLEAQLAYWRKQLADIQVLELPTDRPRPPAQSFRGASQWLEIPAPLTASLKALSRQEGVTLFMTLLAVFKVLLYRYTAQREIVVGVPVAGRNRAETEGLIGFFINTLVLRTELSGELSFRELLGRVRQLALEAYAHQDLPFERLVEELHPERDLSHNPLFQVTFQLLNLATPDAADLADESSGEEEQQSSELSLELQKGAAVFDLAFDLWEGAEDISGQIDYSTDLFDDATISRLIGHFHCLLEAVVADPDQAISTLQLLTDEERQQVLVEWNATATAYPQQRCIHELFEAQVEQSPAAVALIFGDAQLTYAELNSRANQLAHYLRALGVGADTHVGLCVERSLEMVVGLLGILKAGGAYVPLDPAYPKERLAFMLEDGQAPLLLTQQRLLDKLPAYQGKLVCLDTDWETIAREPEQNLSNVATADNLAYVIYTSGSTGQPKGVRIIHRSVVRLVKGSSYASLTSEERFLQLAPISFDASTFEIWGSLLNGARLVIFPAEAVSLEELGRTLQQYQITTLWLTAGLFNQMVEEQLESLRQVRQLLAGGDVLSVPHVQKAVQALGEGRLINGYGPTESTTFTTCFPVTTFDQIDASIPIGRPISNTQVYLLDRYLQPVPVGIPGELYIGGAGLGRDYLNRPELTAERFIPNPFSHTLSARLYRTGDLARYRPDGNIEFIRRVDQQVKIRGFRVELGEIEVVLSQHPAVREAVVVAREEQPGDKRLVAYILPHEDQSAVVSELRHFLKERLPEYMTPSAFVLLDTLPLTPNGKVDRSALPAPDRTRPALEKIFIAPRTEVEVKLAEIWTEVLGLEQVGLDDNFFDLGGHSLLATQIISRVRAAFQVELPLRSIFESPTIGGLAAALESAKAEGDKLQPPPIARASRERRSMQLP